MSGTISGHYLDSAFSFECLQVIKIALVQGDFLVLGIQNDYTIKSDEYVE